MANQSGATHRKVRQSPAARALARVTAFFGAGKALQLFRMPTSFTHVENLFDRSEADMPAKQRQAHTNAHCNITGTQSVTACPGPLHVT